MDKAAILARLREHEPALRERGVSHAAVFGSRARGDNRPDSDVDILVEIGPISLWGVCRLDAVHRGPVSRACRRCGPKPPETLRPTDSRARSDLMHSSRDRSALFDIRDNAALARDFVGSVPLDEFKADRRAFYAATRALEIISEAARRLSPDLRERHPSLPWRAIMGVGNAFATITMMSRKSRFGAQSSKTCRPSIAPSRQR